jgi:hypothetical protein
MIFSFSQIVQLKAGHVVIMRSALNPPRAHPDREIIYNTMGMVSSMVAKH